MSKNELKQLIENMFITFDEFGMEPSTPVGMNGKEVNEYWRLKIFNAIDQLIGPIPVDKELYEIYNKLTPEQQEELGELFGSVYLRMSELDDFKKVMIEFLIADSQKGNDAILKAIMAERTLRTMLSMEGDNHGEQTKTDLLNDH